MLMLFMQDWHEIIGPLKDTTYFRHAMSFVAERRRQGDIIYPKASDVFNAFKYTPLSKLKVVILGQDPYHEPNQAMGLSFSVPVGTRCPPSLMNIYKELSLEYPDFRTPDHGNLIPWARQGVLLLNATLTVKAGEAFSHAGQGWEEFTDAVVAALNKNCEHLVYILWGNSARKKAATVDPERNLILESAHPSPLSASRGFFGCNHFVKANEYLKAHGLREIDWQLPLHLDGTEEL